MLLPMPTECADDFCINHLKPVKGPVKSDLRERYLLFLGFKSVLSAFLGSGSIIRFIIFWENVISASSF
jgi:hypothetical protein